MGYNEKHFKWNLYILIRPTFCVIASWSIFKKIDKVLVELHQNRYDQKQIQTTTSSADSQYQMLPKTVEYFQR
jgi:hypothetical protein